MPTPNKQEKPLLVVSQDETWLRECAQAMRIPLDAVHHATEGTSALKALRSNQFSLIAVDNSFPENDIGPIEFCLYVRDLASNNPMLLVGSVEPPQLFALREYLNIDHIGPKGEIPEILKNKAKLRSDS